MIDEKFLREQYNLKPSVKDAFSGRIAREKDLRWWINREEELKKWRKIIKDSLIKKKNFIVFIEGTYGRGKTLSLYKIIEETRKYKGKVYSIYLNFKGEERSKPGLDFMFRIFKSVDFYEIVRGRKKGEIKRAIKEIPAQLEEPKNILGKIYFGEIDLREAFITEDEGYHGSDKISETRKLALFFLRGQIKPTTSQLKKLQVLRKIESVDIAKEYLAAILCFVKNLGHKTMVLAIDEFEYLFSLVSKSQQNIYLALLRSLYDFPSGMPINQSDIANIAMFIAISEDGMARLTDMEKREKDQGGPIKPLMRRKDAHTTLGRFNKGQTRELIMRRLSYNRVEEEFEDNPLIPFKEDFVDYIHNQTEGEPWKIVVETGQVLDAGLADRVPILTKEYAQKILEERGF